jgi:hypothetical protein
MRFRHRVFSASFVDLVLGFETSLATLAFGSRMARFSAVEAEHFLAHHLVKASASAFESFENATAFGSLIVHFAVRAAVFLVVVFVSSAVSAEISLSTASFFPRPPHLP